MRRPFHFAVNGLLTWLADSSLNVFVWFLYLARIAYIVLLCWWERSVFLTPSLPLQARAMSKKAKKVFRDIWA